MCVNISHEWLRDVEISLQAPSGLLEAHRDEHPILLDANMGGAMTDYNEHSELPPGDYQASEPWTQLVGATLKGDAGVIHQWSIAFNPSIVLNCSDPVIR